MSKTRKRLHNDPSTEDCEEPAALGDTAPTFRFCDLVLTGGVTSGVVYPWAILELARSFRFKNIGGTSAGAMAAALAAAAEFTRRRGSPRGFDVLLKLPAMLSEQVDGKTRLLSLFQPALSTRRLFQVFVGVLMANQKHRAKEGRNPRRNQLLLSLALARVVLMAYWVSALLSLALPILVRLVIPTVCGWLGIALISVLVILIAVAYAIFRDLTKGIDSNNFGLCTGGPMGKGQPPALTAWLHNGIQRAAGRADKDPALTFKELWEAPGFAHSPRARSIDLQVITTNLAHGRPYVLPLMDETNRLFFRECELSRYFPCTVMRDLVKVAVPYKPVGEDEPPASTETDGLLELPSGELPIVVAARLSLSFPFLFSAVPLHAIDQQADRGNRKVEKCWFSDGGLCSNFPIHLFDAALPTWPTFGISLEERLKYRPSLRTWLPQTHAEGAEDIWNHFDDDKTHLSRLGGFIGSLLTTAKNWSDITEMRMPGFRERVVRVYLRPDEGSLNIAMKGQDIMRLAVDYSVSAAQAIIARYAPNCASDVPAEGWNEHRWIRFNSLIVGLRERMQSFTSSARSTQYTQPLADQIENAYVSRPLRGQDPDGAPLSSPQVAALESLLATLEALEAGMAQASLEQPYKPKPSPNLRVRPPL